MVAGRERVIMKLHIAYRARIIIDDIQQLN